MEYREFPPPQALAPIVRCFWRLTANHEDSSHEGSAGDPAFPDGSPELIVNLGDPFEHLPVRGKAVRQPRAFLVGQITRPFVVRPTGRVDLIAVRFEAHGAAVLNRPMAELRNTWRDIRSLGSGVLGGLVRAVRDAASEEHRVAAIVRVLRRACAEAPPDERVARSVRAIRASHGMAPLDGIAASVGLTSRTLQRLYAEHVGVTPKLLTRIARFQRVFAAARHEPGRFSRVALECGYFDQSHLVRDFRHFAGDAPARTLTTMPEFTAFFTGRFS